MSGYAFEVLKAYHGLRVLADDTGIPYSKPVFKGLRMTVGPEAIGVFLAYAASAHEKIDKMELVYQPELLGTSGSKTITFYDCYVLSCKVTYNIKHVHPYTAEVFISAGGVKDSNAFLEYSAYWRTTYDPPFSLPEPEEREEEPEPVKKLNSDEEESNTLQDRLIQHLKTKHAYYYNKCKYHSEWIVDTESSVANVTKPGRTVGDPYTKKATVYIHSSAFKDPKYLNLIVGHELRHVSHYVTGSYLRWMEIYKNRREASNVSEFYAYTWQVEQELKLNYYIGGQQGLEKSIKALPKDFK